jgi:hypothetical protein
MYVFLFVDTLVHFVAELNSLSRSFLKKKAQEQLFDLLQDCFGNYVVQTCLTEGITKVHYAFASVVAFFISFFCF